MARLTSQQRISLTILVAALGYFVDVFDLQLFGMLRVDSLRSLGLGPDAITTVGAQLLDWQMAGMLLGGILWGMLGDKKGRVYVLFGTILLYSLGNIANAFVTNIPAYAAARFFSGLGLAGEIGAGITLASELLPKAKRGYGSTVIVAVGVAGPLTAGYVVDAFSWRACYAVGGLLGLLLLALRVSVNESTMFSELKKQDVTRGHILMLFRNRKRFVRYICCIASALPVWYTLGIIGMFSPELGKALGIAEPLKAPSSLVSYFIGITAGGFISGLVSQVFRSRKKVMMSFVAGIAAAVAGVFYIPGLTADEFYVLMFVIGFFTGYWTLFLTTTAEQFGTNLRATATTTAPNFVRASVIIDTALIGFLKPAYGFLPSVEIVGALTLIITVLAIWILPETFGRDLDFVER